MFEIYGKFRTAGHLVSLKTLTGGRAKEGSKCHETWFRLLSPA